jgi:predicted enzyme related to lactoylglutathione lyase
VTVGIVKSADVGLEFAPNPAGFALRVPDVDTARAELAGAGVELTEVYDTGVCRLAFFSDPDGNRLVLHRRYAP